MPPRPPPIPITLTILSITFAITALQFPFPTILHALQRSPTFIADHEYWRILTPLLVHADGLHQIIFNFTAILILGTLAERIFGPRLWLTLYLTAGLTGEIAGYSWQPSGAGASVAAAGLLGALAIHTIPTQRIQFRIGAITILIGACILTAIHDIHGPPILLGAVITFLTSATQWTSNA